MRDDDKKFGRFPKIAQELAGRKLQNPGAGGAIGRTLRNYASGMVETAKLPGEVLKGKKYSPEEAVNFATSMVAMPGRGGGLGSGARFKPFKKPKNTTESMIAGLNSSPQQLMQAKKVLRAMERKVTGIKDPQKRLDLGHGVGQPYREAIEAATNTGSIGYYFSKMKPEQIAELKARGRR